MEKNIYTYYLYSICLFYNYQKIFPTIKKNLKNKKRKDEEILKTSVDTEDFDDSKMSDNENPVFLAS